MNSLTVRGILAGLIILPATAFALEPASEAVEAAKKPKVNVTAMRTEVRPSRRQVDEHTITQQFWVASTHAKLNMSCAVSDLTFASKASSSLRADPIGPDIGQGCRIEVPGAMASLDGSAARIAQFQKGAGKAGGGQELVSDYVTFQTEDGQPFEQDVYVTIHWKERADFQPSGQYKATIRLVAEIPDELNRAQ